MAVMTIRDIDETISERLRRCAARHGRTRRCRSYQASSAARGGATAAVLSALDIG